MSRVLLNASMSALLGCRLRRRLLAVIGVPVLADTKISRGTRLGGTAFSFGPGFGANEECWFDDHVMFGAGVRVGPRVCIYTKGHPRGGPDARRGAADITVPVVIGDGVWLRGSVTVQPGVIIARGCIIAVGAVVTRSTAPDGFYAGNPARRTHDIDASGNMTPCNQEK